MTDWNAKTQETMNMWMDMQRQMWESWQETMTKVATPQPSTWERTLEAWQSSITHTLNAQKQWMDNWTKSFTELDGTPDEMSAWIAQMQDMTTQWTKFQTDLWQGWIELSKQMDPTSFNANSPEKWMNNMQSATQAWQDHMAKVMNLQNEWMKSSMNAATK